VPNTLARQFRMTLEAHPHYAYQAPTDESRAELIKKLERPSLLMRKAELELEDCVRRYHECFDIWGDAPWGHMRPVDEVGDEDFSPFWLEGNE
jgi:hypothetical protein